MVTTPQLMKLVLMRAAVIALVSLVAFAGIGVAAVTLLPTAESEPLHPIQVNAPVAPASPPPPAPAASPEPAPPPAPPPRTEAGLRDIPEPPPPLVSGGGDDDWDDHGDDDDGGDGDDDD